MHLRQLIREVVFIDTNLAEKRTVLMKYVTALKELPSSTRNVESDYLMKFYMRRPWYNTDMLTLCHSLTHLLKNATSQIHA